MKALVVYDSVYGNTRQIAEAIGQGLDLPEDVSVVAAAETTSDQLADVDLLVMGSATQRFRPLAPTSALLKSIPSNGLQGVKVAAFDTRIPEEEIQKIRILAFFVNIFGYAAEPIAKRLQQKGGELVVPAEGFYVGGTEGPLVEDELERATEWGREIRSQV